jgi:hypothetical protein
MASETKPGYPAESVERALRILLMLRGASVVPVTDVSRELGCRGPRPTTCWRRNKLVAFRSPTEGSAASGRTG